MRSLITYTGEQIVRPRAGYAVPRRPRIVSEHADIDHLLAVVNQLCVLITDDVLAYPGSKVGREYPLLRQAIWNARGAAYRVVKNRDERAKRKK